MQREHELDMATSEYRRHKKHMHGPEEAVDELEDDEFSSSEYDDEDDYDFYANSSEEDMMMTDWKFKENTVARQALIEARAMQS